jgi:hypothetical protein
MQLTYGLEWKDSLDVWVCEIFDIIYALLFLRLFSAELCDAHEFFLKETLCEDMNLRYRL